MRMIHCADLHLDSKMSKLEHRSRERKAELLQTFEAMIAFGAAHDVDAVLIAGDLFDTKNVSRTASNAVLSYIRSNPQMQFYYLKGNHDNDNFLAEVEKLPENLHMFQKDWSYYNLGGITIAGVELCAENAGSIYHSLVLDTSRFNVVMLHGQEAEAMGKDRAEVVHLKSLQNKGIDYLALGHVHSYKQKQLDARGTYCYPGCLEGRGFDECGEHGFVLLDIDGENRKYTHQFIPFAKRRLYTVEADISDCTTSAEIVPCISAALEAEGCEKSSLVKIVLTGTVDVECEKDLDYLLSRFRNDYYFVKMEDQSRLRVSLEDYRLDETLKGEFIRLVMADTGLSEEDKATIIRYGLQALAGEEVE